MSVPAACDDEQVDDDIQIPAHIQDAERTLPPDQRRPHLMHATFWKRQREGAVSIPSPCLKCDELSMSFTS